MKFRGRTYYGEWISGELVQEGLENYIVQDFGFGTSKTKVYSDTLQVIPEDENEN